MTIDERIDALTARHEAMAMSLELIGRDVEALRSSVEALRAPVEGLRTVTESLVKLVQQDGENMRELRTSVERITDRRESREATQ